MAGINESSISGASVINGVASHAMAIKMAAASMKKRYKTSLAEEETSIEGEAAKA
jgi:hypothetical protein